MRAYIPRLESRLTPLDRRRIGAVLTRELVPEAAAALRRGLQVLMDADSDAERGTRSFGFDRLSAMVLFFTSRASAMRTKLLKLLFYSDFLAFKVYQRSLSGSPYRNFPFGPVPEHYELLLTQKETEGLVTAEPFVYQSPDGPQPGTSYRASGDLERQIVSELDVAVLDTIASRLFRLDAKRIAERSHEEIAWRDTDERALIPYAFAGTLSLDLPQSVKLSAAAASRKV